MSKADSYRKRAEALAKAIKKRAGLERPPMLKKQKALMAMADNEDWLDGKPSPQGHARELKTAEPPKSVTSIGWQKVSAPD
jgi:hypothetical protein